MSVRYLNSDHDRKNAAHKGIFIILGLVFSLVSIKGLSLTPPTRTRPSFLRVYPQSVLWIILFFALWIGLTQLLLISSRKQIGTALGISFFYWICNSLGYFFREWGTVTFTEWSGINDLINFICYETGIFTLIFCFMLLLLHLIGRYCSPSNTYHGSGRLLNSSGILFILSVCFLLICWSPWFMQWAPLTTTGDSNNHISQAVGTIPLMDNHPILYTLYIRLLFLIGGSTQAGAFLYSIFQLLISASVFSACVCFVDQVYQRRRITIAMVLWFGIFPVFPMYGMTMWKDVFFGLIICLIVLNICMLCLADESQHRKLLTHNVILSLLMCLIRHNGAIVFIPTAIALAIQFKKQRNFYVLFASGALAFYLLFQFVIIPLSSVLTWRNSEGFSIPLQQIARVVFYDPESLSDDQKQVIADYFSGKDLASIYNPVLSNNVKFSLDEDVFARDPKPLIKLWRDLGKTHLKAYIEAPLQNSYGYWYPEAVKLQNAALGLSYENFCGIHFQPLIRSKLMEKIGDFMLNDKYYTAPVLSWLFTPGLYGWILFFIWRFSRYRNNRMWIALVPLLSLWIQMLGCPAFCELRYVYGLPTSLPLMMCCVMMPLPENGSLQTMALTES